MAFFRLLKISQKVQVRFELKPKKLSLCPELKFSATYIIATQYRNISNYEDIEIRNLTLRQRHSSVSLATN